MFSVGTYSECKHSFVSGSFKFSPLEFQTVDSIVWLSLFLNFGPALALPECQEQWSVS